MLEGVGYLGYTTLNYDEYMLEGATRLTMYSLKTDKITSTSYDIDTLVDTINTTRGLNVVYTHALTYIASYLESYMLTNGYTLQDGGKFNRVPMSYTVLRSSDLKVFSLTICNAQGYVREFVDTFLLYPMYTMSEQAHNLGIDYNSDNLTKDDYNRLEEVTLKQVQVIEILIKEQYKLDNSVRLTRSAYAYEELKSTYEENTGLDFKLSYPTTDEETYNAILPSYWGAKTYIKTPGEVYKDVVQLDYSSSFPSVMAQEYLPIGEPTMRVGKYISDKEGDLFIQRFTADFSLRKNKIPTLNKAYNATNEDVLSNKDLTSDMLRTDNKGNKILVLSSIDFKLFLEHYKVTRIRYIDNYSFKSTKGPFKEFITKHYEGKEEARKQGDFIKGFIHKITMNMSYGKFAQKRVTSTRTSEIDEEEVIKFKETVAVDRDKNYLPMAIFIAAYGRLKLFEAVRGIETHWLYGDTDSVHIPLDVYNKYTKHQRGNTYFNNVLVKEGTLGALSFEKVYTKVRYLKEKTYVGVEANNKLTFKASGITQEAKKQIQVFEDVDYGVVLTSSSRELVKGGYVWTTIDKTI